VRDAAAKILDNTTLADLVSGTPPRAKKGKRSAKKEKEKSAVLPMVMGATKEK
jgi:DNA-binding IscR family transcriptional regulator